MASLLFINSNPKEAKESYTLMLSNYFLDQYRKNYPEDTVDIVHLYDISPPFLTANMIETFMTNQDGPSKKWVKQFKKYDKYLIASPNWNLGVPAILKAYIDLIAVLGETFYYSEEGHFVGLLKEKKMAVITAAGDTYSAQPNPCLEMNWNYMKQIFGVLGIENIQHFGVEGTLLYKDLAQKHMSVLKTQMDGFIAKF